MNLLVVPVGHNNGGGRFGLAFIMGPIVARTTEEMLRLVPSSYREGFGRTGRDQGAKPSCASFFQPLRRADDGVMLRSRASLGKPPH